MLRVRSKPWGLFIFLAVFMVTLSFVIQTVRAETWSWDIGTPVVESTTDAGTQSDWRDYCRTKFHMYKSEIRLITQDSSTKTDCFIGSQGGANLYTHSQQKAIAVQFPGDSGAYRTTADCYHCAYSPLTDTYMNVEYRNSAGTGRIVIYQNFLNRLQRVNDLDQKNVFHAFDKSSPRLISNFYGEAGYFGYINHLGLSSNGKWLVFEAVGNGIFRVNLETMEMVKFSDWKTSYSSGSNPMIEFDVTDNGQYVAIFGTNTPNSIYAITSDCGLRLPANPTENQVLQNQPTPCPIISLAQDANIASTVTNFNFAYQPQFSDDGGKISFVATKSDSIYGKEISLKSAGYLQSSQIDYLSLGDSYSSGEGDTLKDANGNKYYRQYTDTNNERCHLSTRSYPYRLATGMQLSSDRWNSVACSGATAWDVNERGSYSYMGQWDRLKGLDYASLKTVALNEFIPGRQKQIEFVKKYKPKVITLTMGGNDVGFAEKLSACVTDFSTCSIANNRRPDVASEILGQYENLKRLYSQLYEASESKSKIYILGYPNFINDSYAASCDVNVQLDSSERALVSNSVTYLNNVIRQAAGSVGLKYIDIENSLNGHRLCDDGKKYVTGIADPLNWSNNRQESFHPNANGHAAMAIGIWENVWNEQLGAGESLLDYDTCPNTTANKCPDTTATKESIEIPAYFATTDTSRNVTSARMASPEQKIGLPIGVLLKKFSFMPSTTAKLVIHSDPTDLGDYIVGFDGSLSTTVQLPANISAGYHTLILSGLTYSGEPIEYEQTILVNGPNSDDKDDDGIIDNVDACLFTPASGRDIDSDGIDDACDMEIVDPKPTPSPTPSPSPSPSPVPKRIIAIEKAVDKLNAKAKNAVVVLTEILQKFTAAR